MRWLLLRRPYTAVLLLSLLSAGNAVQASPDDRPFAFGAFAVQIDQLGQPADVAVDDLGRIFIAESAANQISAYDSSGTRLDLTITNVLDPAGIAILGGHIYVSERGRHRVAVFDHNGQPISTIGTFGAGSDNLFRPAGLTVWNDTIFVADQGNNRVQVFGIDGTHRRTIGGADQGDNQLAQPNDVDIDDDGNLVIIDTDNHRVQVRDTEGQLLQSWGDYGPFVGLMDQPRSVVAQDERIFVVDENNHRIQVFNTDGKQVYEWGVHALLPHEGEGKLHYPNALAISPNDAFAVVCEHFEDRVQIFSNADPDISEEDIDSGFQVDASSTHFGTRLTSSGNLLAIGEPETHSMYIYRIEREVPLLVTQFGIRGQLFGQFMRTDGIDIDISNRHLLVLDAALGRVQEFEITLDPTERMRFVPFASKLLRSFDLNTVLEPHITLARDVRPIQLRRQSDGTVWILDAANTMLHAFDADMNWKQTVRSPEGENPWSPTDFCLGADESHVYVVDAVGAAVVSVNLANNNVEVHPLDAALQRPLGICIARDGRRLVSDSASHQVVELDDAWQIRKAWGKAGYDDGQFWRPGGIIETDDGRFIVADFGNHRAQIFDNDGQWAVTFGLGRASTRDRPRSKGR